MIKMTHSITIREANFSGNLMTACGAALIGYDYLLTLKRESRFFWKRKPEIAISSILFFVNRYLALFYYVGLGLVYFRCQSSPLSQVSCRTQYYIDIATRYLQYLPWAVFSTLRVYALSRKNWFWSALTFLLSILPIPFDFYADFHNVSFDGKLVFGCRSWALTSSLVVCFGAMAPIIFEFCSLLEFPTDTAVIRGGQIIADAIVIGVTWKATSYAPRGRSASLSLATVMFRNGTLYFIVLLTMNILHIIFTFLPRSFLHSSLLNASYVTKLSEPITTVLIFRFMLDLHQSNTGTAQGNLSAGSDIRSSFGSTGAGGIAGGVDPEDWLINSVERSDIDFDDAWSMQRLHHGDSLDGVAAPIGSK